jgi:probable F420-dependent oxidoreductase
MKVRVGFSFGVGAGQGLPAATFWSVIDALESGGWDSVWLSERVAGNLPDCLAAMAAIAGRTRHLKFGMSVLVVPGRNPMLLAKELATIAVLSENRMVPAFGLGADAPGEAAVFGVERSERAAMMDEAVVLMRRLWTEDAVDHDGRFFHTERLTIGPRPAAPLDVWFGGHSKPAARRVGRLGDGWLPSFIAPSEFGPLRTLIDETATEHDRFVDPEHFGALVPYVDKDAPGTDVLLAALARRRPDADPREIVVIGDRAALRARLEAFIAEGASKFVVVPAVPPADWVDELGALRTDVANPLEH